MNATTPIPARLLALAHALASVMVSRDNSIAARHDIVADLTPPERLVVRGEANRLVAAERAA